MNSPGSRSLIRRFGAPSLLLFAFLAINVVAVIGIVGARREANRIAADDLRLQTLAQARTLEAVLATLRGDLIYFSQSPPLSRALEILETRDLFLQRQGRLDIEGTIYLFVEAHPSLARVAVLDRDGRALLATGRSDGTPVFLTQAELESGPKEPETLVRSEWALGPTAGRGTLEAWIAPDVLLKIAAPTLADRVELVRGIAPPEPRDSGSDAFVVQQAVSDPTWSPPIQWTLVRRETESRLLDSVETLAGRFRATLILNLLVMCLALVLGVLAYRQARRVERLEAEKRHQEQVRELERQVQHSDRLASVGRLAAGIAHEINNPLAGMSNYLALLRDDLRDGKVEGAKDLADRVQEGLDRAAGIVRQVLSFSDPGKSPRRDVDLADVLDRAVEFVRKNPEFGHLEVSLEATARPLPLDGNPTTLAQLFLNLLLNACHAQPEAGRVDVRASLDSDVAIVTVEDRGPGLSDDVLRRLFEPFHSTRGSTGLGLAICRGIVGEHGGRIRAENREGGGARFVVELPRRERSLV